jgi:probable phosphoglycerate mutase
MTTLYLIRHGEAEGNLYRRMDGHYDGALTELGFRQVAALGQRFQKIPLDAVYSSDLCRTMHTAAVLCREKQLPLHPDPRLREVGVGPWEGIPFGNAALQDPEQYQNFTLDPLKFSLPGADTYLGVADRAIAALEDIVKAHPDQSVAVCVHGFLIGSVLCKLFYGLDQAAATAVSANTAVTCITYDAGKFSLEYACDASHLGSDLRRKASPGNLSIRPMGENAIEEYIRYRADGWKVVYGDMTGFDGSAFWLDAQRTMGPDPEGMVVGYLDRTPVGMIQLSPGRDADKGVGYIPYLYLREPFRHQGFGIQLVGHAIRFYQKLGRTRLQLSVAPTNVNALGFYHKYGFRQIRKQRGRFGYLLLMEKDISPLLPPSDIVILPVQ